MTLFADAGPAGVSRCSRRSEKRWPAYNTEMVCPLCEKRKAKRDCPAKGTKICSICCGSEREVTIDCPFECRYLQESRQREYKGNLDPKDFPSKEIRIDQRFLREHAELLNVCGRSLLEGASETPGVVDRDTQEALEALVRTYKTLDSGLYYESRPASSLAQRVADHLQEKVRKFREEQTRQTGMTQTSDNDVLRILVFLQRMALDRDNARPRGKAFLDFLRLHFPNREQTSQGSLIIPGR